VHILGNLTAALPSANVLSERSPWHLGTEVTERWTLRSHFATEHEQRKTLDKTEARPGLQPDALSSHRFAWDAATLPRIVGNRTT